MGAGLNCIYQFSSVAQLCLTLWPHGLQHTRFPHPSPIPGAYSNSCPLSQWCYPTISSSVIPFSSCPQSFPALGSFQMTQFFKSGGQRNEALASVSVHPMNIQDWFPLGLTGLISLLSKEHSSLLQHCSSKASILQHSTFLMVQLLYPYVTTRKTITFNYVDLSSASYFLHGLWQVTPFLWASIPWPVRWR